MKKYISIIAIAAIIVLAGCSKGYLDLNENPNNPSTVPAASLVAAAEVKTANIITDPNLANIQVWMGYWAFSPNFAVAQDLRDYEFTTTFAQALFTNLYSNAFDFQTIIDFAIEENNPALEGIGRTMKSFLMQYTVDVYGNVPYTEAFKGAGNKTPAYDDAQAVYEAIYTDVNLAITKLNLATSSQFPGATEDLMFGGDKDLWIKFANTLKLRILIRQSAKSDRASYIAEKLASDFPDGLNSFLQAGESALVNPGFTNSDLKQSPYWGDFGYNAAGNKTNNNDFYRASEYSVNFYTSQTDLRILYAHKPIGEGTGAGSILGFQFRGNEMGTQGEGALDYSDNLDDFDFDGSIYRSPAEAAPILTDFESLFLQAEARQRDWFSGASAQSLYESGLLQSFTYDFDNVDGPGAGNANLDLLVPTPDNDWTQATDKIKLIITQKWASLNTINFWEPWLDYSRTGFPNIPLSSSLSRGPRIPFRLKYPQTEFDLNGANVIAQGNIDQFTTKIWWMP